MADPNIVDPNIVTAITKYDPTVLYYTFSTIAQTLAAAFAFVGAFVLFRIQAIDRSCKEIAEELYRRPFRTPLLRNLINRRQWKEYADEFVTVYVKHRIKNKLPGVSRTEMFIKRVANEAIDQLFLQVPSPYEISALAQNKVPLLVDFKFAAKFSAFTISLSLILLPLSSKLCTQKYLYYGSIIVVLLFSIICILACLYVIFSVLREPFILKSGSIDYDKFK